MTDDLTRHSMFFFGTLMDTDVLETVVGRPVPADAREAAFLRGVRRVLVAGRTYPMLIPLAGGRVEGLLVSGLSDQETERLSHYEGWEYVTEPVTVRTLAGRSVEAAMFAAGSGVLPEMRDWSLDLWRRKHKAEALPRIAEAMARFRRF